jgi:hypothetical protein
MYKKIEAILVKFTSSIILLYISKKYISKKELKEPILITFIKYILFYKYK